VTGRPQLWRVGEHRAGATLKVSALVYVAALQPERGRASGFKSCHVRRGKRCMRVATNGPRDKKYFYIPGEVPRNLCRGRLGAGRQFMADSEQPSCAEREVRRLFVRTAPKAQRSHPDHPDAYAPSSELDCISVRAQGTEGPEATRFFVVSQAGLPRFAQVMRLQRRRPIDRWSSSMEKRRKWGQRPVADFR